MMRYRITHTTKYAYSEAVPICQNKVHLRPRTNSYQSCHGYRLIILPVPTRVEAQTDYFGNEVEYFSLLDSHHGLSVTATSEIERIPNDAELNLAQTPAWEIIASRIDSMPPQMSGNDCLYAFDSELAFSSVPFAEYARVSFTTGRPIGEAAFDLTNRIFQDFKYDPRATTVSTPVSDVFEQRAGVCQDFAHLQISCLRSLGLPARYVSGYLRTVPPEGKPRLVGADQSHAWISVYCGEQGWIEFDPTNKMIPSTDYITLAYGRDYNDVCPIQGVFVGGGEQSMSVSVDVQPLE